MRGRFRALDAGYIDTLALEHARNPHYREYPPGVANEPVELPIVFGLVDFVIYVFAIYPLAAAYQACFFLWAATIPFGFLSAVMPVGPVSAWYWRRTRVVQTLKPAPFESPEQELLRKRHRLQELAVETVRVEKELTTELPNAGDLHFAFEAQIRQARDTRQQIAKEVGRIDIRLEQLRRESIDNRPLL